MRWGLGSCVSVCMCVSSEGFTPASRNVRVERVAHMRASMPVPHSTKEPEGLPNVKTRAHGVSVLSAAVCDTTDYGRGRGLIGSSSACAFACAYAYACVCASGCVVDAAPSPHSTTPRPCRTNVRSEQYRPPYADPRHSRGRNGRMKLAAAAAAALRLPRLR